MKIAIAGKGGSGKTTIAGILARSLARRGRPVWAIDADSNPNLGLTLGLPRDGLRELGPLPRTILEETTDETGQRRVTLGMPPRQIAETFGTATPDGVRLLLMGTVDHAGAGWMCRAHAAVRHLLAGLLEVEQVMTLIDMEAGLEHLSRGTGRHVDTLLVVLEPYYRALETGRRCAELGRELGIPQVLSVANKLRGEEDRAAVGRYASAHGIPLAAEIPFDDELSRADLAGHAPDLNGNGTAVRSLTVLAEALEGCSVRVA